MRFEQFKSKVWHHFGRHVKPTVVCKQRELWQ